MPGYLLFVRDSTLMARQFDEKRLELADTEFAIAEGIPSCCGSWDPWSASHTVLAFWRNSIGYDTVLRWYARDGTFTDAVSTPGRYAGIALSRDGQRIAFSRFAGGARDIWVRDVTRDTETRLTFDGDSFSPVWSPKGDAVAFSSARGNVPDVYVTNATGGTSDQARRVSAETTAVDITGSWTPDGRDVLYTAETPDARADIRSVPLQNGAEKRFPSSGPFRVASPSVSPDGKWMAYVTDASGRPQVWLAAYPSGEMRVQVSRNGGFMPEWRANDGRELYYLSLDQRLMAVTVERKGSGLVSVGPPTELLHLPEMVPGSMRPYAPAADGRRFLVETFAPGVRQPPIQVIVNWPALLKK